MQTVDVATTLSSNSPQDQLGHVYVDCDHQPHQSKATCRRGKACHFIHNHSSFFLIRLYIRCCLFIVRSSFVRSTLTCHGWLLRTTSSAFLFVVCSRSFVVRSSFVHHSFIIRSSFVRCSFIRCSFVVRSAFVCHSFVVRSTKSPAMADCYVPPHPRFRLSFVRRSFVVCFSFVCRLFVVRLLFVRRSFIIRLSFVRSFVRSSFVRPPHPPWLIVMYHFIITARTVPVPECLGGVKAIHLCPPYCSYPTKLPAGGHHRQIMLWDGKKSYASYKFLRRKIGEGWAVEFFWVFIILQPQQIDRWSYFRWLYHCNRPSNCRPPSYFRSATS